VKDPCTPRGLLDNATLVLDEQKLDDSEGQKLKKVLAKGFGNFFVKSLQSAKVSGTSLLSNHFRILDTSKFKEVQIPT
jgi:hypothetical protein